MSFHDTPELLEEILAQFGNMLDFLQLQINYVDWEQPNVQSRRCLEIARKYNKPVTVMEPCKGGTLVNLPDEAAALLEAKAPGSSPAAWALRFAASQPGVTRVLSGMNTMAQVLDNTATFQAFSPITPEELETIRQVTAIIEKIPLFPVPAVLTVPTAAPRELPSPSISPSSTALPAPPAAFPARRCTIITSRCSMARPATALAADSARKPVPSTCPFASTCRLWQKNLKMELHFPPESSPCGLPDQFEDTLISSLWAPRLLSGYGYSSPYTASRQLLTGHACRVFQAKSSALPSSLFSIVSRYSTGSAVIHSIVLLS